MRSYLRFERRFNFGVLCSPTSNVVLSPNGEYAFSPALENIILYNLNTQTPVLTLSHAECDSVVTCLTLSPDNIHLISGHENGTIRVWNYKKSECVAVFHGHKSAVTCLSCDTSGNRLASGSNDTDIVLWDLITNGGLFRLHGHHQPVMNIAFYDENTLISCSKDSSLKVWELDTQHCAQTLVGHKNEVWTFVLDANQRYIVSGGSDMDLFMWEIIPRTENKDTSINSTNISEKEELVVSATANICIRKIGHMTCGIHLGKKSRLVALKFNKAGNILFAQTNVDVIGLYYVRNEGEMQHKREMRLQRLKQKEKKCYKRNTI